MNRLDAPRLPRRLTLADVARLTRYPASEEPATPAETRRVRERLRRVEEETGVKILSGGGREGGACWTTWGRLRKAGLADEGPELPEPLLERLEALQQSVVLLAEQHKLLAHVVKLLSGEQKNVDEKIRILSGDDGAAPLARPAKPAKRRNKR